MLDPILAANSLLLAEGEIWAAKAFKLERTSGNLLPEDGTFTSCLREVEYSRDTKSNRGPFLPLPIKGKNLWKEIMHNRPFSPKNDWKCILAQGSPKRNPLRFLLLKTHNFICQKSDLGTLCFKPVASLLISGWCARHRIWCHQIRFRSCLFTRM